MPLERLSSPIHLSDSCFTAPPPVLSPIASRTRFKAAAQSSRRRRLAPRFDLPPSHAFDKLPWIASLDAPPEFLNPWDIADLSLLSDADPLSSSGPGPVRRRKTSLRSSPITSAKSHSPPRETSISSVPQIVPTTTPRSRFIPSRVLFHNLMPVVSCDFSPERSRPCITRSRINF